MSVALLLKHGLAIAQLVLKIRDAELQGAEGVTYAWLAQQLAVEKKAVKRAARRALAAGLIAIYADRPGRGSKARLSLTEAGRVACAS